MIINFPRSHLINGFLRRDCHFSPSYGTEPGALHLGGSCQSSQKLSPWARSPRSEPSCGEELQLHPKFCAPSMLVSVPDCGAGLLGDPGSLALAEGRGGDVQGKPETESCEVSDLRDPEDPGSRSPRGQST